MGDSQALAWLERLRTASAEQRPRELQELLQLNPDLHGQVVRLLARAERTRECGVPMQGMGDSIEAPRACAPLALGFGESVAGYRLLRELGRGGLSSVWLADRTDGIVKRAVAVKLPLVALISTTQVERFARERDVLAALTHPNIARLYDAGVTQSGQPYMVLEFVDGMPITAYCDRHQLSVRARLHLYLQVLAAVEQAIQPVKGKYDFISAVGEMNGSGPRYVFLTEFAKVPGSPKLRELVAALDKSLCEQNPEYASKRNSLRLDPPVLRVVRRGEFDKFRKRKVSNGGSDGQFKILRLTDDAEFAKEFSILREVALNGNGKTKSKRTRVVGRRPTPNRPAAQSK